MLDHLAERGFGEVDEVTTAEERLTFSLPQELKRDMKAAAPPRRDRRRGHRVTAVARGVAGPVAARSEPDGGLGGRIMNGVPCWQVVTMSGAASPVTVTRAPSRTTRGLGLSSR